MEPGFGRGLSFSHSAGITGGDRFGQRRQPKGARGAGAVCMTSTCIARSKALTNDDIAAERQPVSQNTSLEPPSALTRVILTPGPWDMHHGSSGRQLSPLPLICCSNDT